MPDKPLKMLKFQPVTVSRWPDLEALFGERGACGGCWCMAWRLRNKDWLAGKGARNKRALKKIVTAGERPGVLGYLGKQPIAWCAVAPRETYSFLERSRVLRPLDDEPVWSISCLFVLKSFRRQGVSVSLLKAAVAFAAKRGATIVEGYPTEPTMERTPDPFVWTGIPSAFRKAGFREVLRRSRTRPIMRFTITGVAASARGRE
jgi:GNAT superfamily N-acetyltransferase